MLVFRLGSSAADACKAATIIASVIASRGVLISKHGPSDRTYRERDSERERESKREADI